MCEIRREIWKYVDPVVAARRQLESRPSATIHSTSPYAGPPSFGANYAISRIVVSPGVFGYLVIDARFADSMVTEAHWASDVGGLGLFVDSFILLICLHNKRRRRRFRHLAFTIALAASNGDAMTFATNIAVAQTFGAYPHLARLNDKYAATLAKCAENRAMLGPNNVYRFFCDTRILIFFRNRRFQSIERILFFCSRHLKLPT